MSDAPPGTFSPKVYDVLKWIALVLLPALGALYFGLGQIWKFPAVEEVVGSITVIDTFLGILLNKSSKNYRQATATLQNFETAGEMVITQNQDGEVTGMKMFADQDPFIVQADQVVSFRVRREVDPE